MACVLRALEHRKAQAEVADHVAMRHQIALVL